MVSCIQTLYTAPVYCVSVLGYKLCLICLFGLFVAFFQLHSQEGDCHGSIGNDFLFEEQVMPDHTTKYSYRQSKYTGNCLAGECGVGLSVISVNNTKNRKCFFRKIPVKLCYPTTFCRYGI